MLTAITDADGATTEITRVNGTLDAIAPLGNEDRATRFVADPNGYLAEITNPAEETVSCDYSDDGLLLSYTTPADHESTFSYEADGRLATHTAPSESNPTGDTTTLVRTAADATGHTVEVTSPEGRVVTYEVDRLSDGRLELTNRLPSTLRSITTIAPDGQRTTTLPDGMMVDYSVQPDPRFGLQAPIFSRTITSPEGRVLTRSVERTATPASTDPDDLVSATETVVVNGRPPVVRSYVRATDTLQTTSAEGHVRTRIYDSLGRLELDARVGTLASPLDPILYVSQSGTGLLETISQGEEGDTRTYTLHYDAHRRVDVFTDPLARDTLVDYDEDDRIDELTLVDDPASPTPVPTRVVAFTYDANGNLETVVPPHTGPAPVHSFDYTPVDLTAGYTPPTVSGTGSTDYHYNGDRQLELITRPDGQTIDPEYEVTTGRLETLTWRDASNDVVGVYTHSYHASGSGAGRLSAIQSTVPLTSNLGFSYDGCLLKETSWTGLVSGTATVGRAYDDDLRLEESTINGTSPISFLYDDDGLLTHAGEAELVRSGPQGLVETLTVGNVKETRAYNEFGEIASITSVLEMPGEPHEPLLQLTYPLRDTLGRLITQTETVGIEPTTTIVYGYDPAGRLQDVTRNGMPVAPSPAYAYDPNGNRLAAPGLMEMPLYDSQDRLLSYGDADYAYTPNGELVQKTVGAAVTEYEYDVFGNLRAVTLPDGSTIEYVVDALHRRVGRRVEQLERAWLYDDQLRIIAELDGEGVVVSRFVYASRGNVPDYMIRYDDPASGQTTTYAILSDHLGSPRLVVNATDGTIARRTTYDEFGRNLVDTNPGFQPFGFAGGISDHGTGLVRFGARDYDPEVGRWTAKDPSVFNGGDPNVYGYALNNPVQLVDPTGNEPIPGFNYCGPGQNPDEPEGTCKLDEKCRDHDDCYDDIGLRAGTMGIIGRSQAQRDCDFTLCKDAAKVLARPTLDPRNALVAPMVMTIFCRP